MTCVTSKQLATGMQHGNECQCAVIVEYNLSHEHIVLDTSVWFTQAICKNRITRVRPDYPI